MVAKAQTSSRLSQSASSRAVLEPLEGRTLMTVVLPGGGVAIGGTTAAARPELAGVVVHDSLIPVDIVDASGHTIFKGDLQDRVVKETKAGTLDFYQTLRADAGFTPRAYLDYAIRSNFGGGLTDVDYRTDGLGSPSIKPESVIRSSDSKSVVFKFGGDLIAPGQQSLFYMIKTNATAFDTKGNTTLSMQSSLTGPVGTEKLATAEPVPLSFKPYEHIVNGSFESPALTSSDKAGYRPVRSLPAWSIFGKNHVLGTGDVDVVKTYWAPYSGNQSLDLVGDTGVGTGIEQTIATIPGQSYKLTFAYANNTDSTFDSARVEAVGLGGMDRLSAVVSHSHSTPMHMNYALFSQTFIANSNITTIRFTSLASTNPLPQSGIALDAVSVVGP